MISLENKYCNNWINYSRAKTKEVVVGDVGIGGRNPIRVQSMTTTDTMDTHASAQQAIKMIEAGCELVRFTAPSIREAKNLQEIKKELIKRGHKTPLIADIHFTPNAAIEAAKIVEKVRINPGNFSDRKRFQIKTYSKHEYQDELKRIEKKFYPLIEVCKRHNTVMRIGTNHGSLSDRIMSQYGDTPLGMVESALEFVRICEKYNYHQIILSMKASNPIVMVQAYRLLAQKMNKEKMNYPLHLGVTEAGEGDDGRIKSAIGIGSLLMDGLGDTIRVSLTEPPEKEIPVARDVINYVNSKKNHDKMRSIQNSPIRSFMYSKRSTRPVLNIGGRAKPIVMADFHLKNKVSRNCFRDIGYKYNSKLDKWIIGEMACDYVFMGDKDVDFNIPGTLGLVFNYEKWILNKRGFPLLSCNQYLKNPQLSKNLNIVSVCLKDVSKRLISRFKKDPAVVILIKPQNLNSIAECRAIFVALINNNISSPVILSRSYENLSKKALQIETSIDMGSLLLDGLGDGVFIADNNFCDYKTVNQIGFNILQATRTRISKTEYISCPSCGRTQFDLEKTTTKIRHATSHLKGLKIGVMGCIVNGPGEMADADYGYVGTGPGRISLYKEKKMVKKNIPTEHALEELVKLIKAHGDWVDA